MSEDEITSVGAEKDSSPTDPETRIMIGFGAMLLLYLAIYAGNSAIMARIENGPIPPSYVGCAIGCVEPIRNTPFSIAWLLACSVGAALAWWWSRPRASVFTIPFALLTGFWLFPYWLFPTLDSFIGFCADGSIEESSEFARGMFFACAAFTVIGITRLKLGEGRQQTATLKRMVGIPVREVQPSPTLPQDTLLRASSPPESPRKTLLRPSIGTVETAPKELLRASQSKDQ